MKSNHFSMFALLNKDSKANKPADYKGVLADLIDFIDIGSEVSLNICWYYFTSSFEWQNSELYFYITWCILRRFFLLHFRHKFLVCELYNVFYETSSKSIYKKHVYFCNSAA